jgi:hypothetical protein
MKGLQELLKKKYDEKNEEKGASYETKSNTLRVMNQSGYNMYAGTVPPAEVARRRAKNKRARATRKASRRNVRGK